MQIRDSLIFRKYFDRHGKVIKKDHKLVEEIQELCSAIGLSYTDLYNSTLENLQKCARADLVQYMKELFHFDDESKAAEHFLDRCSINVQAFYRRARKECVSKRFEELEALYQIFTKFGLVKESLGEIEKKDVPPSPFFHKRYSKKKAGK